MNYQTILESAQSLSAVERAMLISALTEFGDTIPAKIPCPRLQELLNKQTCCPHCGGKHYYRYGKDKGSQRFKCKECRKTFTEYSGTWQAGLHKKRFGGPICANDARTEVFTPDIFRFAHQQENGF